jgi:demethylmenaquinone methyltransferase / 2-methoxy-6-polyprenyl-1,4-benzoquinol methylase
MSAERLGDAAPPRRPAGARGDAEAPHEVRIAGRADGAGRSPRHDDVRAMFQRIAPKYDAANRVMSAGVDRRWRKQAITRLLEGVGPAPRILDLGAGTLDGAVEIARRAPGARVAAADFAGAMLRAGRDSKLLRAGDGAVAARIGLYAADGHTLPFADGAFDGAFSAFCVRNLADLPRAMRELRRVVRPGGRIAILEFFRPERRRLFFDRIYNAHVLPLIGWAITGDRQAYRYLPASIAAFASSAELGELLRACGFGEIDVRPLFPAAVASLVVAR